MLCGNGFGFCPEQQGGKDGVDVGICGVLEWNGPLVSIVRIMSRMVHLIGHGARTRPAFSSTIQQHRDTFV